MVDTGAFGIHITRSQNRDPRRLNHHRRFATAQRQFFTGLDINLITLANNFHGLQGGQCHFIPLSLNIHLAFISVDFDTQRFGKQADDLASRNGEFFEDAKVTVLAGGLNKVLSAADLNTLR